MSRYANPYGPMTPVGAGLQNIALALFGGTRGTPQRDYTSQNSMYDAHGELYREQAGKAAAERKLAERLLAERSDDTMDLVRASEAGVPIHTMRGIDAALRGEQDMSGYTPEQIAGHRRATLTVRPAYADKTVDSFNVAKAINALREREDLERIRGVPGNPTRTAQAYYATSGKAPFDNMGGTGTFNLLTGEQSLNELGRAKVVSERALAGERGAHARLYGVQTDEITSGAKYAPVPVVKKDAMGNDMVGSDGVPITELVPRPHAVTRTPAPRGEMKLVPTVNEDGETVYTPVQGAVGAQVGARPTAARPTAPRRISGTDRVLMEQALNGFVTLLGHDALDDATQKAVMVQAEKEWQNGAQGHENAVKAALDKVAPQGLETPWQWRSVTPFSSRARPVGGSAAPTPAPTPAPAPGAASQTARPQGKSDQQLVQEANEAIRRGAPRDAVLQRLKAWGVAVN